MTRKSCFIILLFLTALPLYPKDIFSKGVNLTEWFQENSPRTVQSSKYTKKDFQDLKSLGCDVIRLPINLHAMTGGAPDYKIDPLLFRFLDEAVNICEELNISLIIDNHSFDPSRNTDASIENILTKVWVQLAGRYESRGDFLYYEILNEPHGINPAAWGKIELNVLKKIREIDKKHAVIVGGCNWDDIDSLYLLPDFGDDNIIYTFHFYEPMLFAHQGDEWMTPSLAPLTNVPYPYRKDRMPLCPSELLNTWVASGLRYYPDKANDAALETLILKAVEFRNKTGKPLYCGEFGVYMKNSPESDRVYWYEAVRKILMKYSIPRTSWDYRSGFGLFKKGSNEVFETDLNLPLLKALGFSEPAQKKIRILPETSELTIFRQYPAPGILLDDFYKYGVIDLYCDTVSENGQTVIKMENLDQYGVLRFSFKPMKDLSALLKMKYNFVMKIKLKPGFKNLDVRFISTRKDDTLSLPWRIRFTLDEKSLKNTSEWQTVAVPLEDFREQGTWKDKWYSPEGLFDWSRITAFEVVAENGNWQDTGIFIAEMKVSAGN